jgi:hypothetical protein
LPNRILREGINSSPRINSLPPEAEILYRRLLSVVDDFGRFYANLTAIRGACWPTHLSAPCEQSVGKSLTICRQGLKPLIRLYEANGLTYLQVTDFGQKIRSKSKFPEPERWLDIQLSADCQQVADKMSALGEGEGDIRIAESEAKAKTEHAPKNGALASGGTAPKTERERWFAQEFWVTGVVWVKVGTGDARKAWLGKVHTRADAEMLIAAARRQGPGIVQHAMVNGHSVLHPATWINQERYRDDPGAEELMAKAGAVAVRAETKQETLERKLDERLKHAADRKNGLA